MGKRISLCMNVAGFLRNNRFPQHFVGVFSDNGRTLTPVEAHDFLLGEVAKGHKVIPCSAECGNPCQHASSGCTGFDYSGGGCPGREVPDPEPRPCPHSSRCDCVGACKYGFPGNGATS